MKIKMKIINLFRYSDKIINKIIKKEKDLGRPIMFIICKDKKAWGLGIYLDLEFKVVCFRFFCFSFTYNWVGSFGIEFVTI